MGKRLVGKVSIITGAARVEEELALRRKRGRKRSTVRQPLPEAVAANQVWSVDFMTDALSFGAEVSYLEHRG